MNSIQGMRITSIFFALLIGFWLPLRLLNYALPEHIDTTLRLILVVNTALNIGLHFAEKAIDGRKARSWLHPAILADFASLIPIPILGILAVRHILRIKAFLDEYSALDPVTYRLLRIGLTMPLLVHVVSCIWIALGSGSAGSTPIHTEEYIKAVYWSFTTLATVGYGDITPVTPVQMIYACLVQLAGVGVFGFVLTNVASLLSRMDAAREHHMDNLERAETFMHSNRIPKELRSRVYSYYQYVWKNHRGYKDQSFLSELPTKLQSDLHFYINRPMIEKVAIFKHASPEILEELMTELKPRVFAPGERIFKAGDPGDSLYFIHNGRVEILTDQNEHLARLEEGSCFGEMALVSEKPRNATARAETFCRAYALSKEAFTRVVATYPEFKARIEQMASERNLKRAA